MGRQDSARVAVAALIMACGLGCATVSASMTYRSKLAVPRVPVRVAVEVEAPPGALRLFGDGNPSMGAARKAAVDRLRPDLGVLALTFRDALRADLAANGPFTVDQVAPQATLPAGDGRGGLFTTHLVEALATGSADANGDGQISARELIDWVQPRVLRDAKREQRDQTPALRLGAAVGAAEQVIISFGYPTR
jgi:hypothetical protein